mmetsp:Transcript_49304/g.128631  ORF Transcript_49304/g.128631 Transcript_49304/m.128631 type:complete len:117 (-) Transcript_49304:65-415(-)
MEEEAREKEMARKREAYHARKRDREPISTPPPRMVVPRASRTFGSEASSSAAGTTKRKAVEAQTADSAATRGKRARAAKLTPQTVATLRRISKNRSFKRTDVCGRIEAAMAESVQV